MAKKHKFRVLILGRQVTDVEKYVEVEASNSMEAKALVQLQIAKDEIPDWVFVHSGPSQLTDVHIDTVQLL